MTFLKTPSTHGGRAIYIITQYLYYNTKRVKGDRV